MRKKTFMLLLVAVIAVHGTSIGMAAEKDSQKAAPNRDKIYSILAENIYKWLQNNRPQGGQDNDAQKPGNEDKEEENLNSSSQAAQVLKIVNSHRKSAGLKALSSDAKLNYLAQLKAEDMAENKYFSHNSPTYGSAFEMLKKHGYAYKTAGENIAKGQKTPQAVMKAWMNSQGHRQNILSSSYSKLGVGCAKASDGTLYWVQIFAG